MTRSRPDNGVGIVVQNDGDVLVPLLVAGLVNAYAYKTVQPTASVRFDFVECTGYAVAYGLPINAHVFRNRALGKISGKPSHHKVEILGKPAAGIGPGNICHNTAVFGAFDALGITPEMDEYGS